MVGVRAPNGTGFLPAAAPRRRRTSSDEEARASGRGHAEAGRCPVSSPHSRGLSIRRCRRCSAIIYFVFSCSWSSVRAWKGVRLPVGRCVSFWLWTDLRAPLGGFQTHPLGESAGAPSSIQTRRASQPCALLCLSVRFRLWTDSRFVFGVLRNGVREEKCARCLVSCSSAV